MKRSYHRRIDNCENMYTTSNNPNKIEKNRTEFYFKTPVPKTTT